MKKTIKMNERELHRLISESVKRVLNEDYDFNKWDNEDLYERFIFNKCLEMRNDLNIFLKNCQNEYPGEYQMAIDANQTEYKTAFNALLKAFNSFKSLCLEDWEEYD